MTQKIRSIGVLTSGGDSPGMNCAIRSVVRTAIFHGIGVVGIKRGYSGIVTEDMMNMNESSVGNIIQKGGTILQTSRCPEFHDPEVRKKAAAILKKRQIDGLVIIGGDGSFNGAYKLYQEHNIPVVGIPGTIDNDISGTEYTVGFDTAVETAIEAVDRIRDTASSHARIFLIEVMGRSSSAIALNVGVCTGAENIVLPNSDVKYDEIVGDIKRGAERGKDSSIIIVAEGHEPGKSYEIGEKLKKDYGYDCKVCVLGHIQRGGRPSPLDRYIASEMGYMSVKALLEGNVPTVAGYKDGKATLIPFEQCLTKMDRINPATVTLARTLSI